MMFFKISCVLAQSTKCGQVLPSPVLNYWSASVSWKNFQMQFPGMLKFCFSAIFSIWQQYFFSETFSIFSIKTSVKKLHSSFWQQFSHFFCFERQKNTTLSQDYFNYPDRTNKTSVLKLIVPTFEESAKYLWLVWFFSSHFLTCYLKVLDEIFLHHLRYIVIFSSNSKRFFIYKLFSLDYGRLKIYILSNSG